MEKKRVHRVLFVRHSERIDEVDLDAWFQIVANHKGPRTRDKHDHHNDPILTERGHGIAAAAGHTLLKAIKRAIRAVGSGHTAHSNSIDTRFLEDLISVAESHQGIPIRCIYASRLRRAIETAYQIALHLKVPIFISSGLAQTAKAVEEKTGGNFQFHTLEEIRAFCPGVDVYSCDPNDLSFVNEQEGVVTMTGVSNFTSFSLSPSSACSAGDTTSGDSSGISSPVAVVLAANSASALSPSLVPPTSLAPALAPTCGLTSASTADGALTSSCVASAISTPPVRLLPPHRDPLYASVIPQHDWYDALASVALRSAFSIIVCHRESIRNLSGLSVKVPYCCMGMFYYTPSSISSSSGSGGDGGGSNARSMRALQSDVRSKSSRTSSSATAATAAGDVSTAGTSGSAKAPPRDEFSFQYLLDNLGRRVI